MKQISFIDDIFEEMDASDEQKLAVDCFLKYVVKQTKDENVFAIEIPKIGVLHRNIDLTTNSKKYFNTESEEYKKIEEMLLQMKYFKQEKNENTPHRKKPITFLTKSYLSKKYELPQDYNTSDKQVKEVYSAIEKEQQKQYERNF